jgi:hypothetical protein
VSDDKKLPKPNQIDPNLEGDWKAPERSLDAEGKVVGEPLPPPKASSQNIPIQPHESGLPRLQALKTSDLELVRDPSERPSRKYEGDQPYREEAYQVKSRKGAIIAMLVLLVAGAGGVYALNNSSRLRATMNSFTPKGPLVISTDPSGAELWLGGTKVGNTPWAVDNTYVGQTTYEVRLKGYKTKKGTFNGGIETHLSLELVPE